MDISQNYQLTRGDRSVHCIPERDSCASGSGTAGSDEKNASRTKPSNDNFQPIVDNLREKNQQLELERSNMELRCRESNRENDRLNHLLSHEKLRAEKYQKKLQYIQDNQEIFNRLKQAYLNMKYQESTTRPIVEIREQSCQTWQGIVCASCIERIAKQHAMKTAGLISDEIVPVQQKNLDLVKDTLQKLKTLLKERNVSASMTSLMLTEERESKYQKDIATLFKENMTAQKQLSIKQMELDELNKQLNTLQDSNRESSILRKIIAKIDKKLKTHESKVNYSTCLNDKEEKIVQHITSKFEAKLKQKTSRTSPNYIAACSVIPNNGGTPYMTPRSFRSAAAEQDTPRSYRSIEDDKDSPDMQDSTMPTSNVRVLEKQKKDEENSTKVRQASN